MFKFSKKEVLTQKEQKIEELKEELRNCELLINRAQQMFDMTTDEMLIEARIYEIKGLLRHHDYLINTLKNLIYEEETVNS